MAQNKERTDLMEGRMRKQVTSRINILMLGLVGSLVLTSCSSEDRVAGRWYSQKQVDAGASIYAAECAQCHGDAAQGRVANWKQPDSSGNYPPPPLNGSAHAWHHPLRQLERTVRQGGVPLGGQMPGFGDRLSAGEIEAVLAWVQSHWSEGIYTAWVQRGGLN